MMSIRLRQTGFTLIELLVVIAVIAVLAGVAAPYYQDYIIDSRRAVLRQNVANLRRVTKDFQGDNGRGPFRVPVDNDNVAPNVPPMDLQDNPKSNLASGSELVSGPIQIIGGVPIRRSNLRYIPALPRLIDPENGLELEWNYGSATLFFIDDAPLNGIFNMDTELAYIDEFPSLPSNFESATDTVKFNQAGIDPATKDGDLGAEGDFIDVIVTDSLGVRY